MYYELQTAPAVEPVAKTDVKETLRFSSTSEDDLLDRLIETARRDVEARLSRQLITATYDVWFDDFAELEDSRLPMPPLQSVSYIKYYDADGDEETVSNSIYEVISQVEPAYVRLAYDQQWPAPRSQAGAVWLRMVCGYGDAASDVPGPIKDAIRLLIGHMFIYRDGTPPPQNVDWLLDWYVIEEAA